MADYRFPGEHVYKNLVLTKAQTVRNVEKTQQLSVVDGDVLIATYNKTGNKSEQFKLNLLLKKNTSL